MVNASGSSSQARSARLTASSWRPSALNSIAYQASANGDCGWRWSASLNADSEAAQSQS